MPYTASATKLSRTISTAAHDFPTSCLNSVYSARCYATIVYVLLNGNATIFSTHFTNVFFPDVVILLEDIYGMAVH